MARHSKIGKIGENLAVRYLENNGFLIVERNFFCRNGEIDIIAKKLINLDPKNTVKGGKEFRDLNMVSYETNNLHGRKEINNEKQLRHAVTYEKVTHEKIYFIEVKTKSVEFFSGLNLKNDVFAPENNFNYKKRERMFRAIKYYLLKNNLNLDIDCEISLLIVYLNQTLKQGKIKFYETVVLS